MANENSVRDSNQVTALLAIDDVTGETVRVPCDADGNLLIAATIAGGGGTVTSVSVVTANGVSGSVATATTTPAITLTLGAITPTSVNIGATDSMVIHGVTVTGQIQVNSDTLAVTEVHTHSNSAAVGASTYGARSRGTTATPLIVQSGDIVSIDSAVAYDGTDYEQVGYTAWLVGGTPGANDMPGKYIIAVTPDGGFTPATAVTVNSDKSVDFASTINKVTITAPATGSTLTIADGKTITVSNTLTLAGTDSTVMTFPTTSATIARTDAANTFTGASTASAWVLTSPTITTKISPTSDDGAPLGDTTHNFSDLFLASGAVINYANSNVVVTHTSGILTMGTGELRITTPGTNSASVPSISSTNTFTNKRITNRVLALSANSATPAINTDSYDVVHITSQTAAITSFTSSLSGTPVDGDTLRISVTGTGAVGLTFGASFEASTVALPTTTVGTNRLDMGFFWNSETSKWRIVAQS